VKTCSCTMTPRSGDEIESRNFQGIVGSSAAVKRVLDLADLRRQDQQPRSR
jgi:hypothetical protein